MAYKTEYPEGIIVIKRSQILSPIIQKDYWEEKDRDEVKKYIEIIKEHYEIIGLLEQAYNNFYKILMGKDAEQLETFIKEYEESPIKGFVVGIKKISPWSRMRYLIMKVVDLLNEIKNSNLLNVFYMVEAI